LIIYLFNNTKENSRFGFTVSKKVGNAVIRNKIRRKLKEICRLNCSKIKKGFDVIIIARPAIFFRIIK
ncbi:MAG: ribonuclease P protein component, partial [Actinobacteria bacterium]|nr:ribonuclease P protein component [Actinomycetota bacterium]